MNQIYPKVKLLKALEKALLNGPKITVSTTEPELQRLEKSVEK